MPDISMELNGAKNLIRWFHILAGILLIATMGALATFVFMQTQAGAFAWWPYPVFTLLVVVIFMIDGFLSRKS